MLNRNAMRGGSFIEQLERRALLAADVSVSSGVLTITGDDLAQDVQILDSWTEGVRRAVVSVDADGNGSFTDAGDLDQVIYDAVSDVVVRLGGGADKLSIRLADAYEGATKRFDLDTGDGSDTVVFENAIGNAIRNSTVDLNLLTGRGKDNVRLELGQFSSSSLTAQINTGAQADQLLVNANGYVGNSTVAVSADTGAGNDVARNRFDWDAFDILGASTSTWRVGFVGSDGDDRLEAVGELGNTAANVFGVLDISLSGKAGNDIIEAKLDRFNLNGGMLKLRANGGAGADTVSLAGLFQTSTTGGVLDLLLKGGGGQDILSSSADASGTTGTATLDGGAGTDTATSSGTLAVQLLNVP